MYYLEVGANDGLFTGSAIISIFVTDVDETGVNDISINDLKVYPNPTSGLLNVQIPNYSDNELTIIIRNILGKAVQIQEFSNILGTFNTQINLKDFESGIYFMDFMIKDQVKTIRFIKE